MNPLPENSVWCNPKPQGQRKVNSTLLITQLSEQGRLATYKIWD